MSWRFYLLFGLIGILPLALAAVFQTSPGYMDADYYYAGGLRLEEGKGFSEEILWNYLDDPAGLPHQSHCYWMPMVSILAALGMLVTGQQQFSTARLAFILVAAMIPPITGGLAWRFSGRKSNAVLAAVLACLPAFYLPFLPVSDAFGLSMLLGGIFFLIIPRPENTNLSRRAVIFRSFLLGLLAGLMHLTRADGALWTPVALLAVMAMYFENYVHKENKRLVGIAWLACLVGYGLVMAPWLLRNQAVFGSWLAPGGSRALWITSYEELFIYPAGVLTAGRWWEAGLGAILRARIWAAGLNLQTALAVQGLIFLAPLVLLGLWRTRKDRRVQLAGISWLLILLTMTVIFPFQGARGGFFHSGAALQPFFWAMAPLGLEAFLDWGRRRRGWRVDRARPVFSIGLALLALCLSISILYGRLRPGSLGGTAWDDPYNRQMRVEQALQGIGVPKGQIIMANNSPGFYIASRRPAISIPYGDLKTVCSVAWRYQASYLLLDIDQIQGETELFLHPADRQCLHYIDTFADVRVFLVLGPG
jgi:hypothetical protein